jgi:hypothetical protein
MRLYKYIPPERLDVLRNLRVRFTQPGAQNDLFELRPVVDRFRRHEVARQTLAKPLSEEWDRQFSDKILKQFGSQFVNEIERIHPGPLASKKEAALAMADAESDHGALELIVQHLNALGIFSLSEVPDDLLMWAHYAANHTGFVLEFDGEHAWFRAQRPKGDDCGTLKKVSYADEPSSRYLAELKAHEVFYTKGKKWEYEREWRIIRPLAESSMSPRDGVFLFDVPATAITSVIAGLRTSSESLQELQRVRQGNHQLTHLRIGRISEVKNSNTLEVIWA